MKSISVNILLLFIGLQLCACGDDDGSQTEPDISIIAGLYDTDLQHDVISNTLGFEEIDTSYLVDFSSTTVNLDGDVVSFSFPKGGRYEIPDLTYEVSEVQTSELLDIVDVYLTLLNTTDYRMKASSNQVPFPAFRILVDNQQNINNIELSIFLRSQDPDSVYNIFVVGNK